ncbi:MAG TPA: hypothetical protein VGF45_02570, partial [Polyangia bacterium]
MADATPNSERNLALGGDLFQLLGGEGDAFFDRIEVRLDLGKDERRQGFVGLQEARGFGDVRHARLGFSARGAKLQRRADLPSARRLRQLGETRKQ